MLPRPDETPQRLHAMNTPPADAAPERTCPRCGLMFRSEKLDGLCPSCLMNALFASTEPTENRAFWEEEPAAPAAETASTQPAESRRFSHFELFEELGRGGMGVVYRACDLGTGRIVALKVLQAHHLSVPDLVQRFRAEVRAVTSLDHPHVLPVHEVGEHDGIPFFSMKLTTGGSLAQRIGDFLGKPTKIAQLLTKIARGVAHAHERCILHRDLKPGNILLDAAGEPYVCDFGLAKWIEDDRHLTVTNAVLGTPHYIAPEQANGQKGLSTAVDIYSLGAILYELLTGRPPFVGQSIIETLRLASQNTPERPSSLARNVPRDLETICLKCLEREPSARYPTAAALADDLDNWLQGKPIFARPVGAAEQLWRWARRNPLPASLIASIALLLAITAVGATIAAFRIEAARGLAVSEQKKATERLHESLLAQANVSLLTGQAGQRVKTLEALREAAAIEPSLEVRNLAIQALALSDLEVDKRSWSIGPNSRPSRAFDSSLTHIAEEAEKGVLRVLHLDDNREIARLVDEARMQVPLERIVFSPDDQTVAARHQDGTINVWNIATETRRFHLTAARIPKAPWYATNFVFSPDGKHLAIAAPQGGIAIHDAQSGRELARLPGAAVYRALAFSPDGNQLAATGYEQPLLEIWDVSARSLRRRLDIPATAYSIAWNDRGDELAAGSFDYSIYLFNTRTGDVRAVFSGHRQEVTQVLFTPAGDQLISTSLDMTIRLWSLSALTQEVVLKGYGSEPALRFAPDGRSLAATSASRSAYRLHLHNANDVCRTLVNGRAIGRATLVGGLALSDDGQRAATTTFEGLDVWNLSEGRHLGWFPVDPDAEKSVRFRGDSLLIGSRVSGLSEYTLTSRDDSLSLAHSRTWDAAKGFIFSNTQTGHPDWIELTSPALGIARIFDLQQGRDVFRLTDLREVWDLSISPDRKTVAVSFSAQAAPDKGRTQIRSLETGELIATLPGGQFGTARFAHDGKRLKLFGRGEVSHLFNASDWSPDKHFVCEGHFPVFDPHQRWIATTSGETIHLWSLDGKRMGALQSPLISARNARLACTADGNRIVAHSTDNVVLVWNLRSLSEQLAVISPALSGLLP